MRLDRFTSKFQLAIAEAQSMALGRDHQFIEPIHLMFALLDQEGGSTKDLFSKIGINTNELRSKLSQALERLPKVEGADANVQLSAATINMLNLCDKYAQKRKDQYISSELFVLAACEDKSELGHLLRLLGLDKAAVEKAIDQIRGGQNVDDPNAEDSRQALNKYTVDLTARAEAGKLDPVIGRDEEIRRCIQVCSAALKITRY